MGESKKEGYFSPSTVQENSIPHDVIDETIRLYDGALVIYTTKPGEVDKLNEHKSTSNGSKSKNH